VSLAIIIATRPEPIIVGEGVVVKLYHPLALAAAVEAALVNHRQEERAVAKAEAAWVVASRKCDHYLKKTAIAIVSRGTHSWRY